MTDRLLAALLAASEGKVVQSSSVVKHPVMLISLQIDYKKVARYFGNDTTYDTIHSRFRKAIIEAKTLIKEAEGRDISTITRGKKGNASPSKTSSPSGMKGTKKRANGKATPVFEFELC